MRHTCGSLCLTLACRWQKVEDEMGSRQVKADLRSKLWGFEVPVKLGSGPDKPEVAAKIDKLIKQAPRPGK